MEIVLIPGFWLDGASWDEVAAPLRTAGHAVHALTLPGLESRHADRSGIGLRDHVDAVVAVVDSLSCSLGTAAAERSPTPRSTPVPIASPA
jgi:pimeloyl-ACP methyl ester carboxylesterase